MLSLRRSTRLLYPIGKKVLIKNVNRQNKLVERYEGPYLIHNVTDSGSHTLMDKTVDKICKEHYEIQAVFDHRGSPGNHLYKVHWKGFDDSIEHTWKPVENFDSTKHIELYWGRRGSANATGKR
ncbi:hypothetical protein [Parasitella parasitica]|uniref:Chromo domain-containing protein n=1 Tax=Parasitella parasitica TaxID=35722 RepID=A0A0B7N8V0_9FUNG|nr:hypothetical protein [Parasitella parasitica]